MIKNITLPEKEIAVETKFAVISNVESSRGKLFDTYDEAMLHIADRIRVIPDDYNSDVVFRIEAYHGRFAKNDATR